MQSDFKSGTFGTDSGMPCSCGSTLWVYNVVPHTDGGCIIAQCASCHRVDYVYFKCAMPEHVTDVKRLHALGDAAIDL